jgi:hypothetical protein
MKVQVNLKVACQSKISSNFEFSANAEDTVLSVKERIAASQLIAFPDQDLVLNEKVLDDQKTLAQCGVHDAASLDFVIKASEESLAQQLGELLQARDLSSDELGLLYCYKHGVNINQALKTIGFTEKFPDFIRKQKHLSLENGRVSLIRDAKPKPEEIKKKPPVAEQPKPVREPQLVPPREPRAQAQTQVAVTKVDAPEAAVTESSDSQEYLDLHNTISGRSFNSKVAQTLNDVIEIVSEKLFLNVASVAKGGSVGKGTAINGVTDAEVVFFLEGLPPCDHSKWLPALLRSVAGVLTEHFSNDNTIEGIETTEDSVHMKVKSCVELDLRFSPQFGDYKEVIQAMSQQRPDLRKHYNNALVKEKVQFISKQPGQVKVTMRLLKWWRDQQRWSSALKTPSDDILELVAVYSALTSKPRDQRTAVVNAISLMAKFDELRIVWSNYYEKEEIWAPLLQQRPLLMDPVNPFVNVAAPQNFDASELMATAKSTHFFW